MISFLSSKDREMSNTAEILSSVIFLAQLIALHWRQATIRKADPEPAITQFVRRDASRHLAATNSDHVSQG